MADEKKCKPSEIITKEAVLATVKADKGQDAKLLSWKVIDFCEKGDNWATFVTSVEGKFLVNGNEEDFSYVVKVNPSRMSKNWSTMIRGIFDHEIDFFTKIGPRISTFLPNQKRLQIPTCFYSSLEPNNEMMFCNDLRLNGFKMHPKKHSLDVPHCTLLLTELARMHAGSWIMLRKHSLEAIKNDYPSLNTNVFSFEEKSPMYETMSKMFCDQMDSAVGILSTYPEYELAKQWIMENKNSAIEIISSLVDDTNDTFRVIGHGDCWNNNFLYRYNEDNEPIEVMLLDLQICRYSSLAIDLNHCIFTSTDGPLRRNHLNELLKIYYDSFCQVLKVAEIDQPFTFEQLLQEFIHKNQFGFVLGLCMGIFVIADKDDLPNFDNLTDEEMQIMLSETMPKLMMKLLEHDQFKPRFLGLIDDIQNYVKTLTN